MSIFPRVKYYIDFGRDIIDPVTGIRAYPRYIILDVFENYNNGGIPLRVLEQANTIIRERESGVRDFFKSRTYSGNIISGFDEEFTLQILKIEYIKG